MMNLEQKKKEFLFKLGKSLEATEEKRDKPENLTFEMVREKLSRSFFAEIENKKTGEILFDTRDKLDIFLSILSGEKQKTGVLKNLDLNDVNINIYTINREDLDNTSDKITYFLLVENYGTCEKGIREALTEAFNKAEPLNFSKSMLEKAENFQNSFSKFENAFKEYENKYNFDITKEGKKNIMKLIFLTKETKLKHKSVQKI